MKLAGKIALVTGSSQGIGQAVAERLAAEGADVVVNYVGNGKEAADKVVAGIKAQGRRSIAVAADVSQLSQVQAMFETAQKELGLVDILVNNAGVEKGADFWDITEKDFNFVIDVNLKGTFFNAQTFVKALKAAGKPGKIINISSVHEDLPFPHFTSYCASKGAVKMLTRNASIELAPLGITINNVAPGAIETPINAHLLATPSLLKPLLENIPLKRLGKTSDVSGVVAFLASAEADYITGTTFVVDGGLTWNYSEQ